MVIWDALIKIHFTSFKLADSTVIDVAQNKTIFFQSIYSINIPSVLIGCVVMAFNPLIYGSLINHLAGLPICIALAYFFQSSFRMGTASSKPWIYMGGLFGVVTILIFNITVPKVSALRLTLLSFIGGLVITTSLLTNMALQRWSIYKKQKNEKYWKNIREAENAHWEKLLGNKTVG